MQKIWVEGGKPLVGNINIHGAKNALLPILAASLMINGISVVHNAPKLSDTNACLNILKAFGAKVKQEGNTLTLDTAGVKSANITEDLTATMRSSITFLGAALSRFKKVNLAYPGGCKLGPRPIDIHIDALEKLGVTFENSEDNIIAVGNLKGAKITFPVASVGATENIILAATLAKGETVLENAAKEPEIVDLANFLNSAGAKINGAGTSTIVISGVKNLHSTEYSTMPDRIAATTYLAAAAITRGDVTINNISQDILSASLNAFEKMGCDLYTKNNAIRLKNNSALKPLANIKTGVYPGFATDVQPLFLACTTLANGNSKFTETIFENRFSINDELVKFGAKVSTNAQTATIKGVNFLSGAKVKAQDLRGAAALTIAALAASGESTIYNPHFIDRGYENFEENFKKLGATIARLKR